MNLKFFVIHDLTCNLSGSIDSLLFLNQLSTCGAWFSDSGIHFMGPRRHRGQR